MSEVLALKRAVVDPRWLLFVAVNGFVFPLQAPKCYACCHSDWRCADCMSVIHSSIHAFIHSFKDVEPMAKSRNKSHVVKNIDGVIGSSN